MNKLTIAALAAFAGVGMVGAADSSISSANVVGYVNTAISGKKYVATGSSFIGVGKTDKFKLADLAATGWDWEGDELRILDPATANASAAMFYLTKDEAADMLDDSAPAGWYDGDGNCYNEDELSLGQGFMTRLVSNVSLTSAGEVYGDAFAVEYKGKTDGAKYNMVPNPVPAAIKLGDISATGWNWEGDELRVLDPATCNVTVAMFYLTKEEAADMLDDSAPAGWYDGDGNCYNDETVNPGEGFMTRLVSDVRLVFPSAF